MPSYLNKQIAAARLEAALIRTGYSDHTEVSVRISEGNSPQQVAEALASACRRGTEADLTPIGEADQDIGPDVTSVPETDTRSKAFHKLEPTGSNIVVLRNLYDSREQPTHAVVSAELIEVPETISAALIEWQAALPKAKDGSIDPTLVGWTVAVDPSRDDNIGVILRINTLNSLRRAPKVATFAGAFTAALGVPTKLEFGMLAQSHAKNLWATGVHNTVATGMSIGRMPPAGAASGGTITIPVRVRAAPTAEEARHFILAAHTLYADGANPRPGVPVYQPYDNFNPDREIGAVRALDYVNAYGARNFFDVALVQSKPHPNHVFGRAGKYQIIGVFSGTPAPHDQTFVYGISRGMLRCRVTATDAVVTVLSTNGTRLQYRDMIEICTDHDDAVEVSSAGDSGAPLLVRRPNSEEYYVAGMLVGGGSRRADARRPRSYVVPIGRILDRFGIDLW